MTQETAVSSLKPMIPTAEGCFVDPNAVFPFADGTAIELLEWAPASAFTGRSTFDQAQAHAAALTLAGGGWKVPSPKEWVASGINYSKELPASDLPDAENDWFWTDQVDPSSPSDLAFYVNLLNGYVRWNYQDSSGRVRFCRRVRASQFSLFGS